MKYKSIDPDDLQKLIDSHAAPIVLEYSGTTIQNVRIALGNSHFKIAVGSYCVTTQVPEQTTKYKVVADLDGVIAEKMFDEEAHAISFKHKLEDKYSAINNETSIKITEVTNCSDLRMIPNSDEKGQLCI